MNAHKFAYDLLGEVESLESTLRQVVKKYPLVDGQDCSIVTNSIQEAFDTYSKSINQKLNLIGCQLTLQITCTNVFAYADFSVEISHIPDWKEPVFIGNSSGIPVEDIEDDEFQYSPEAMNDPENMIMRRGRK
jgi:hypothetical protein